MKRITAVIGAIALWAISPDNTIAQINRSGAAPVQRQHQPQEQQDNRFPIGSSVNLPREPQSNVDQRQADRLRNFAKDQPDYALRNMLGQPSRSDSNSDVYYIKGSGSPFQASKRLVIHYQWSPVCGCRVGNWHQE